MHIFVLFLAFLTSYFLVKAAVSACKKDATGSVMFGVFSVACAAMAFVFS